MLILKFPLTLFNWIYSTLLYHTKSIHQSITTQDSFILGGFNAYHLYSTIKAHYNVNQDARGEDQAEVVDNLGCPKLSSTRVTATYVHLSLYIT